jgi:hypothetical protein
VTAVAVFPEWPRPAWFHPPAQRFFRFFTTPRIVVYIPDERDATTIFRRVQGGFGTCDLG